MSKNKAYKFIVEHEIVDNKAKITSVYSDKEEMKNEVKSSIDSMDVSNLEKDTKIEEYNKSISNNSRQIGKEYREHMIDNDKSCRDLLEESKAMIRLQNIELEKERSQRAKERSQRAKERSQRAKEKLEVEKRSLQRDEEIKQLQEQIEELKKLLTNQ